MNKITVAVIGLGYWGPNVLRNLSQLQNVTIKYACDLKESNLKKLKKIDRNIIGTNNFYEILKDKDVDAVSIATPLSTHYKIAKKALESKKHVLLEKPFANTTTQSQELLSIAKKNKLILMAGHTFVYSSAVNKLKNLVDKGALGKIYYYDSIRINLGLYQADTNVIWDLAVHDFSILSYIFNNKPISVRAIASQHISNKTIDDSHIFLRYKNGTTCHIHVSWLSPIKIRRVVVAGSKRMIQYDDIEPSEKIRIYDKGILEPKKFITPFNPAYRSGNILIPKLQQKEALYYEVKHFVDCILYKQTPITGGKSALEVISMLEACDESIKKNKEIML